MMPGKVYVVGAGLAGLSAAVALAQNGRTVELIESAGQAGGRCRSYFDATLGHVIDNGNHFILSGNYATMRYLRSIGAEHALVGPEHARTSFVDIATGERWTIAPNDGPFPHWLFDGTKRVPGTTPLDYLALVKLLAAGRDRTIGDVLSCKGALWDRLLQPFFLGALNTQPEIASAALAASLVRETFAKGGRAYRTRIAHPTLAAVFVDPALRELKARGAQVTFGERVRSIVLDINHATALETPERMIAISGDDAVILATPPWVTGEFLPEVRVPNAFSAIVNAHFMIAPPPGTPGMLGILGGTAEWVFSFADRISVTVSGADRLIDTSRQALAEMLWSDVARVHGLPAALPPWQIVKEKRATFAATPVQAARRAKPRTRWRNLHLAGDWTDTGLPATIEGTIRSGYRAAELAIRQRPV